MKFWFPSVTLALMVVGLWGQKDDKVTVIISGGARGHLSPCGCTKPMSGGLKRLATVVGEYKAKGPTVWIDAGDITSELGRQSQLKAETYSELLGELGVDAVAYTSLDQKQGMGLLAAGTSLSRVKWISAIPGSPTFTVPSQLIQGITVTAANKQTLDLGFDSAGEILLFDGPEAQVPHDLSKYQLIVTSTDGIPFVEGDRVSPGSHLRGLIIATFEGNKLVDAKVEPLPAPVAEDSRATQIYATYLSRVTKERLIEKVPRESNEDFAGSANCKSCHGKIYDQYSKTLHAHAYETLVKDGHGADPDCVSCHVVGLHSTKGFAYQKTPKLAQVGCESCHGGAREHARAPKRVRLPKVTEQKCLSCHTPTNSAGFNFQQYWKKIKH